MPVLAVAVTRSLLVVTSVVAFAFQMRVDDQFLVRADDWRKHQPDDREMSGVEAIRRPCRGRLQGKHPH